MSSAEWGPLAEVPSHLTSPIALFSLEWVLVWFTLVFVACVGEVNVWVWSDILPPPYGKD